MFRELIHQEYKFDILNLAQTSFKIIVPGKVFRNEATDATHEAEFFQIEGMMVAKKVSMADLKGTLEFFVKEFSDLKPRSGFAQAISRLLSQG